IPKCQATNCSISGQPLLTTPNRDQLNCRPAFMSGMTFTATAKAAGQLFSGKFRSKSMRPSPRLLCFARNDSTCHCEERSHEAISIGRGNPIGACSRNHKKSQGDRDRGVTLDQLKIFIAVAEREHITRAASALGLAPPSVSAAVASLEREFGTKLFHRVGRGIVVTEGGN